jgi:pimeloyl-ACP methyl ester carboxylesterase
MQNPDANPYTVRDLAADVLQLLNFKAVDHVTIIGHGLGGIVAMQVGRKGRGGREVGG